MISHITLKGKNLKTFRSERLHYLVLIDAIRKAKGGRRKKVR